MYHICTISGHISVLFINKSLPTQTEGMQGTKEAKETKMVLSNFSKNAPHFNLKDDFALAPNEKFPVGTHFYCMLLSKGSQSILAFFVN